MKNHYGLKTFVMDSGERYCIVMNRSSGLPVYYPTLYLTTQLRNRGDAFSTMSAAASNLIVLLRFLDIRGIDLEQRFLTKNFLKPHELDDLRDFAQRKQAKKSLNTSSTLWQDSPESFL